MQLLKAVVLHKAFGRGEVIKQDEEMVTVSFPKPFGKKKFLFPSAFLHYLTLDNKSLSSEMKETLHEQEIKLAIEKKQLERSERLTRFSANVTEKAKGSSRSKKTK